MREVSNQRIWQRKHYRQGICPQCGQRKRKDFALCAPCRRARADSKNAARYERIDSGDCRVYGCNEPISLRSTIHCDYHAIKQLIAERKRRCP